MTKRSIPSGSPSDKGAGVGLLLIVIALVLFIMALSYLSSSPSRPQLKRERAEPQEIG